MWKKTVLVLPILLLLILSGCKKPVALDGVKRVAVLTLENYTNCPELGEEIKREILAQMPRDFVVEVIDGAALEAELFPTAAEAILSGRAGEVARRHGVDAFILGEVTNYTEGHQEHLDLGWGQGQGLKADAHVDLSVTVGFNLRLVRAADGGSLIYRQSSRTATEVLSFGLGHPYVSFTISAQPVYPQLRAEAVRQAVRELFREIARTQAG